MEPLHIIGGGMAGSEAAWQAAQVGVPVVLHEMRPQVATFAHRTGDFAEMVCSNLLSDAIESLVNFVGAGMALGMLTIAARPADESHVYGHSKAEYSPARQRACSSSARRRGSSARRFRG